MLIASGTEDTQVESITGLSPTISISQKTVSHNPRSTVGTITEIYDFYRLLYLRIGKQKCIHHDEILQKHTIEDVLQFVRGSKQEKFFICSPIGNKDEKLSFADIQKKVVEKGFVRFLAGGALYGVGDEFVSKQFSANEVFIIIDRLTLGVFENEETLKRLRDSIDTAWNIGSDFLAVYFPASKNIHFFSQTLSCPICRLTGEVLTLSSFSFNFHQGACPKCHGLGSYPSFMEDHIVNKKLTLEE